VDSEERLRIKILLTSKKEKEKQLPGLQKALFQCCSQKEMVVEPVIPALRRLRQEDRKF
jgi:hypothetical protein